MTAADESRQAAAKVREKGAALTDAGAHRTWREGWLAAHILREDEEWVALMSPALAEPLAAWLEDTADTHQKHEADGANWCRYCAETWPCGDTKRAREVARAINGGAS